MDLYSITKEAVFQISRYSGINAVSRYLHRKKLLTLCYHGVVPHEHIRNTYLNSADSYLHRGVISVAQFRHQLCTLTRHFHPVSADDVLDWFAGGRSLPRNAVLVTLDDGLRNAFQHAAPILEREGIPALFNLPTGYIGTNRVLWPIELYAMILSWPKPTLPTPNGAQETRLPSSVQKRIVVAEKVRTMCKRIPDQHRRDYIAGLKAAAPPLDSNVFDSELVAFMSWDNAQNLIGRGFAIGSHSIDHPILTSLLEEDLMRELRDSKAHIEEKLQTPCHFITYPNGGRQDFSADVIQAAKKTGYRAGFSLVPTFSDANTPPFEFGRICSSAEGGSSARFEAIISGLYSFLRHDG